MTQDDLQQAQLKVHPDTIFVTRAELLRLMDKHLGHAHSQCRKNMVDEVAFHSECQAYVIPRKGKNERPWFGIRDGVNANEYHSFS